MLSEAQDIELREVVKEMQSKVEDHISKFTFPISLLDFHQMAQGYDVVRTDNGLPFFNYVIDYQTVAQITIDPKTITEENLDHISVADKQAKEFLRSVGISIPNRAMRRKLKRS